MLHYQFSTTFEEQKIEKSKQHLKIGSKVYVDGSLSRRAMNSGNESGERKAGTELDCYYINPSYFDIDGKPALQTMHFMLTIPTSLAATLTNVLVLISILKTPSLHTPSNILLVGLSLSDLGVGIVVQPISMVTDIAKINQLAELFCRSSLALGSTGYCLCGVSLLILTAISLDRYIAIYYHLRYNEIVTVKRVITVLVSILLAGVVNGTSLYWSPKFVHYSFISVLFLSISFTTCAYFRIYKVVLRHQSQIDAQVQAQAGQRESLNLARYKKSFMNVLIIYCVFLFCYFPYLVANVVLLTTKRTVFTQSVLEWTLLLLYMNSTVNPLVYCWRFQQIRATVTKTARELFCKVSAQ